MVPVGLGKPVVRQKLGSVYKLRKLGHEDLIRGLSHNMDLVLDFEPDDG